jgi:chromatin remodeling complex protein RSC6
MFRSAGAALLRSGTSAVRHATTAAAKKAPAAKEGTRGNTEALMRTYVVSRELSEFLGKSETTRSEATSKVWEYIRNHNLQVRMGCRQEWSQRSREVEKQRSEL